MEKDVGIFLVGFALVPRLESQFPEVAGAGNVLAVLVGDAPELEKDFLAAWVGAETFAEELLGLVGLAQFLAEPEGGDDEGFDAVWVEGGGEAEPGEDFPFQALGAVVLVILVMGDSFGRS